MWSVSVDSHVSLATYGKVGQLGSNVKNSTLVHLYLLLLQHSLLQEVCKESSHFAINLENSNNNRISRKKNAHLGKVDTFLFSVSSD